MSLETDDKEKIGDPVFEYSWWVQMYIMHMFILCPYLCIHPFTQTLQNTFGFFCNLLMTKVHWEKWRERVDMLICWCAAILLCVCSVLVLDRNHFINSFFRLRYKHSLNYILHKVYILKTNVWRKKTPVKENAVKP